MAIPDKTLELNIDPEELTLDEVCLFEAGGATMTGLRAFLISHSNWTPAEIGGIKVKEMKDLGELMRAKIQEIAVPNPS